MVIFRYEWRRNRRYILGWAAAMGIGIFFMEPVYYSMMNAAGEGGAALYRALGTSDFFKTVGMGMEYLTTPLGMYSFLTSFFMLASGGFGLHFGMAVFTKECVEQSAEFLFTRPCGRMEIFKAKAAVVFSGVLTVEAAYFLGSFLNLALFRKNFDWGEFLLIALSLGLLTAFFAAMGLLLGVVFPANQSPLLTAGLVVFAEYCVTSFSRVVGNRAVGFLSPFSFFNGAEYTRTGFYAWDYMVWYLLLFFVFLLAARAVLRKRDVRVQA